jgi:glucosamine--fructose-6-phosphate aminotransferase (isomerizing)
MVSNIQEIRARGARTIVIAEEGDEAVRAVRRPPDRGARHVPTLLAAAGDHRAAAGPRLRDRHGPGHDVDQPRNLAKSVTVE